MASHYTFITSLDICTCTIVLFSSIMDIKYFEMSEALPFKTHLIMIYFHPYHIQPLFKSPTSSSRNPNIKLSRV